MLKTVGEELGMDASRTRRFALQHKIPMLKVRTAESHGQLTLAVTPENADRIKETRIADGYPLSAGAAKPIEVGENGTFYLIQLVPEICQERIKMGFTATLDGRLSSHRTCCPTLKIIKSWPCRRSWEQAVIASVTRSGCKRLSPEVYHCESVEGLLGNVEAFFSIMPAP